MVDYWHTNNSETYHKTPKGWESEQTVRKKQIENLKNAFLCNSFMFRHITKIWQKGEWNFETSKVAATMLSKITDSGIFLWIFSTFKDNFQEYRLLDRISMSLVL